MWCGTRLSDGVAAAAPSTFAQSPSFDRFEEPEMLVSDRPVLGAGLTVARAVERLTRSIAWAIVERPKMARGVAAALVFVGFACSLGRPAKAGLVLDPIQAQFQTGTSSWMAQSLALANSIFLALMLIIFTYNIVAYYVRYETVKGMLQVMVRSVLGLAIPYGILQLAPTVLSNVVATAEQLQGKVTGAFAPTSPDTVFTTGAQIGWGLLQKSFGVLNNSHFRFSALNAGNDLGYDVQQGVVDLVFIIFAAVLCISMITAFTFIAVELLMAYLQAYFTLPLGAWSLGFMATPATANIAAGYWSGVLQTLVRFVAILAAVTLAQNVAAGWATQISTIEASWGTYTTGVTATSDIDALKTIISFALGGFALLYIVKQLPALAMSVMSGSPVFSGARVLEGTASTAATVGMMAATGGAGAAMMGARAAGAGAGLGGVAKAAMQGGSQGAQAGARRARTIRNLFR